MDDIENVSICLFDNTSNLNQDEVLWHVYTEFS